MSEELHRLALSGGMLQRGFWLYVLKVQGPDGKTLHYVGRTGDSSSPRAQSPFTRVCGHLGSNRKNNALLQRLCDRKIEAENCTHFEMIACGPIYPEASNMEDHRKSRDIVAALEHKLCEAMMKGGYELLNTVSCRKTLDPTVWERVRAGFTEDFPNLGR